MMWLPASGGRMSGPPLVTELGEMGAHAVGRRRAQRRRERRIDAAHDVIHRPRAFQNRLQNLLLTLLAVGDVLVDQRRGIVHDRTVPGQEPARTELAHEPE